MNRRFTVVTVVLTAVVAFLVGAIFAGGITRASLVAGTTARPTAARAASRLLNTAVNLGLPVSFADVVERINPAVVNIDATTRGREGRRHRSRTDAPDPADLFASP